MSESERHARRCRVLVIEDNEDVRRLLRLVLADEPIVQIVGEAANGADGIVMATDLRPDIIVLDINMPVMDGLTALPDIRRAAPNAAIVVWTASVLDDRFDRKVLELGADAMLRKGSGDPLAIIEFIRAHCRGDDHA